ncbi:MAG: hypothetical protein RLZZ297_2078 [Chloroflexota bacterium]|jgi:hypothetical protein
MAIVFVFIDGIGLAPATPDNPFATTPQPYLRALIGGPLLLDAVGEHPHASLSALDACFGHPGLPQSGTGQTALFAGVDAVAAVQRHQAHFPPTALHETLRSQSVLRRAHAHGQSAFANAFDSGYWEAVAQRRIRKSASVIAAEGAPARFRDVDDLARGAALSWDITNHVMHQRHPTRVSPIDAYTAGVNLAMLARGHVVTLYETFLTDLAGHGRVDVAAAEVVTRIDRLIGGIVATLRPQDSLVISSDHGNFECQTDPSHTCNPVPLLVVGPARATLQGIGDISQIAAGMTSAMQPEEE